MVTWPVLLLLLGLVHTVQPQSSPVVSTVYGDVQGSRKNNRGCVYDEFLGIPFAAPPVEELRWQKPELPDPWIDVLETTEYSPHCIQIISLVYPIVGLSGNDSEDCLYLNVWVPGGVDRAGDLPVMVWFYGGGFILGMTSMYPGNELACLGDVVVVSINYRVSSLGFLTSADEEAPGNYGLWDGLAGLEWIQDNIDSFRGDPSRVTIFGQSAGAGMVGHTMLSPETAGLFQRVIPMSGAATSRVKTAQSALQSTVYIAQQFGCPTNFTDDMIECLKEEDAEDIDMWSILIPIIEGISIPYWGPVIDGEFIVRFPRESWQQGVGGDYDFMTGRTRHDMAGFILSNILGWNSTDPEANAGYTKNGTDDFIIGLLERYDHPDPRAVLPLIREQYPNIESDNVTERTIELTQLGTDMRYSSVSHEEANSHSSIGGRGNTFVYEYQYRPSFLQYKSWVNGSHIDDLYSVFGEALLPWFRENILERSWQDDDTRTLDNMISYLSNFAYNGDPSVGRPIPVLWPQFNNTHRRLNRLSAYMSQASIETETEVMTRRFSFWRQRILPGPQTHETETIRNLSEFTLGQALDALAIFLRSQSPFPFDEAYNIMSEVVEESYIRLKKQKDGKRNQWI